MTRSLFALLIALLLLPPVSAASASDRDSQKAESAIVAKVNGQSISAQQLDEETKKELRKYAKYGMNSSSSLMPELRKQTLGRMVNQELLRQASSRLVIKDLEEQVRAKVETKRASFKSPEEFDRYLAAQHLTAEEFTANCRRQIQMDAYLASLGKAEPSEEEITAFYNRDKESFKNEERIKVRHILLAVDQKASDEEKKKVRLQAEQLLAQLKQNIDKFAELAAANSACAQSKGEGGDLGYIKHGYMPPEFDEAAFSLPVGELSVVVATKYGFHILQVTDRQPAGYASLAKVHDFIKRYLQEELKKKQIARQVEELRKQADIKLFLD